MSAWGNLWPLAWHELNFIGAGGFSILGTDTSDTSW